MFLVYGYHPEKESAKWLKKNSQHKTEKDDEYKARYDKAMQNMKGKRLAEYGVRDVAEKYEEMLHKEGYKDLSVNFYKLVPGIGKNKVSRKLVSVSELNNLNMREQDKLKAMR